VILECEDERLKKTDFPGDLSDWINIDIWARYHQANQQPADKISAAKIVIIDLMDGAEVVS